MITSSLNPDVVKTYLDGIFQGKFMSPEGKGGIMYATAEDTQVFNQNNSTKAQETMEEFKGGGEWESRSELQEPAEGNPQALYATTFVNDALAQGISIPKRFFDDDQWSMVEKAMSDFGIKGRATKNKQAFSVYRNGFASTIGDGVALFSASHPVTGGVQSNLITTKIAEASLQTAIVTLATMKERDAVVLGYLPDFLLVDINNFKRANIILGSELRSNGSLNDMNVYSARYGITLKTTPYIGTVAGGSNDYWYLGAEGHGVMRFLRQDINTNLIPWQNSRNRTYHYSGEFRQAVGGMSYCGIVGSDGSTGSYDT